MEDMEVKYICLIPTNVGLLQQEMTKTNPQMGKY